MARGSGAVPRRPRKQDLPQKICPVCHRPFSWRKKWARDWENVRYCSDGCRRQSGTDRSHSAGKSNYETPSGSSWPFPRSPR
ncbi:DUF2256 domain-containing protein [Tanticharoenia sakaeratensis]|nr:DUF2256 domain-containing protein [Tanticharoenia sakaeratensis]